MTIRRRGLWIAALVGAVVAGWLATIAGLTLLSPAGQAMAIVGDPARAVAIIAEAGGNVMSANRFVTFARSDEPGFARRLYAAGALLVIDADQAGGCTGRKRG